MSKGKLQILALFRNDSKLSSSLQAVSEWQPVSTGKREPLCNTATGSNAFMAESHKGQFPTAFSLSNLKKTLINQYEHNAHLQLLISNLLTQAETFSCSGTWASTSTHDFWEAATRSAQPTSLLWGSALTGISASA